MESPFSGRCSTPDVAPAITPVVVARDAQPGQRIQLAIFAMNGPLSAPPANFIWFRSATLDFYGPNVDDSVMANIDRKDLAMDQIVSREA